MVGNTLRGTAFGLHWNGFGAQAIRSLDDYRLSCLDMARAAQDSHQPRLADECRAEAAAAERYIAERSNVRGA